MLKISLETDFMKKKIIFGTSTPRSGGTLMANIISLHPNVLITKDIIHFFRHIYKKYNLISNKKNYSKLFYEFCLRVKYRNKIELNAETLINKFRKFKKKDYNGALQSISEYFLDLNVNKNIIGENANSEWHNIKNFLLLDKNYKAFQVIRDPRAVLVSWKSLTYEPGYRYLIILFYWLDAIIYCEKNLSKFGKKRFLKIRFEDIHHKPIFTIKKIYKFLNLKFNKKLLQNKNWNNQVLSKFNYINITAYTNKRVIGFSKKRTNNWKKKIKPWEIAITQHMLNKFMVKNDYDIINVDKKELTKGLRYIKEDKILNKYYLNFKKYGKGTHERLSDPTKPENWMEREHTNKNIRLKFKDTSEYKNYMDELKKIKQMISKI